MTIEQFQNSKKSIHKGFQLITDSQDVNEVLLYIGKTRTCKKHGIEGLYVKQHEGDYTDVYGFKGTVPYLYKSLVKLL